MLLKNPKRTDGQIERKCSPGELVEHADELHGLILLLLFRHSLHRVRLLFFHSTRHRINANANTNTSSHTLCWWCDTDVGKHSLGLGLPVLLRVTVLILRVMSRLPAAPHQTSSCQQACSVPVTRVLNEAGHWNKHTHTQDQTFHNLTYSFKDAMCKNLATWSESELLY